VAPDRIFAYEQFFGDLAIVQAVDDKFEYDQFAVGQFGEKRLFAAFFAGMFCSTRTAKLGLRITSPWVARCNASANALHQLNTAPRHILF